MCVYGAQRLISDAFTNYSPHYLLRQGCSMDPELTDFLEWLASKPQRSSCLCFPSPGITGVPSSHIALYLYAGDLNSSLPACLVWWFE